MTEAEVEREGSRLEAELLKFHLEKNDNNRLEAPAEVLAERCRLAQAGGTVADSGESAGKIG